MLGHDVINYESEILSQVQNLEQKKGLLEARRKECEVVIEEQAN